MQGERTERRGGFVRWQWDRLTTTLPPDPRPGALGLAEPNVAYPRAPAGQLRITWVGHATLLLQVAGLNILTDPIWGRRASPLRWAGPARLVPPGVAFDRLPPIDAVLLSHDHYDHLDDYTVRRLHEHFGDGVRWFTPLGYLPWFARRGVRSVTELDWWQEAELPARNASLRVVALPAQHWARRNPLVRENRSWASWAVVPTHGGPAGPSVYFGGDSGYSPSFAEIGKRFGPFDAAILPIGAYEPRWFMRAVHMNPEEAVQAFRDLGSAGVMVAMHWGTFRLADEAPLEPPVRLRAAWTAAGLTPDDLWILGHGETGRLP